MMPQRDHTEIEEEEGQEEALASPAGFVLVAFVLPMACLLAYALLT